MTQKRLDEQFPLRTGVPLLRLWPAALGVIEARLRGVEQIRATEESVLEDLRAVGLARVNEFLEPIVQRVLDISELGFLQATSDTTLTLADDTDVTLYIPPGTERELFTPGPWIDVGRQSSPDSFAIAQLLAYDKETGALDLHIVEAAGPLGPFDDWQVTSSAGVATFVAGQYAGAAQARLDAIAAQVAAQAARDIATTARDQTQTAAILIAGGPVSTVAGLTGAVTAAGLRTALAMSMSDVSGLTAALAAKATPADITAAISALKGTVDAAHDTLQELAALVDTNTAAVATNVTAIGTKVTRAGDTLTGALNFATPVSLASASTVNIGAAASNSVTITGTTTITSFDTIAAGAHRKLTFSGALTLTHNGTSLILPGAANITTAAGDTAEFVSLGSGNWRCLVYTKASGLAVVSVTQDVVVGTSTTVGSAVAQVDIALPSGFKSHQVRVGGVNLSANDGLVMRLSNNGSTFATTGYRGIGNMFDAATVSGSGITNSLPFTALSAGMRSDISGVAEIFNARDAAKKTTASSRSDGANDVGGFYSFVGGGIYDTARDDTHVRFFCSSGANISAGVFTVYGFK